MPKGRKPGVPHMKKDCLGCRALTPGNSCALYYPVKITTEKAKDLAYEMPRPLYMCPKPRTFAELATSNFWRGEITSD